MNTLLIKNFLKKLPEVHSVILLDKQKIRYFDKYIPERIILITENPEEWHKQNFQMNKKHYPWGVRFISIKIANFIQKRAAKIFYNNFSLDIKKNNLLDESAFQIIESSNDNNWKNFKDENNNQKIKDAFAAGFTQKNFLIRYGVISKDEFIDDLRNWTYLKVSSYLHMPNNYFLKDSPDYKDAIIQNYMQAITFAAATYLNHKKKDNEIRIKEIDFYSKILNIPFNHNFLFYINKKYDINKFIKENKEELRGIYANLLKTVANMQKYKDLKNYIKFDEENKMFVIKNCLEARKALIENLAREVIINLPYKYKIKSTFFPDEELRNQLFIEKKQYLLEKTNVNMKKVLYFSVEKILRKHWYSKLLLFFTSKYFFLGYFITKILIKLAILYVIAKKYGSTILPMINDEKEVKNK